MLMPVKFIFTSISTSNPAPDENIGFPGMKGFWTWAAWIRWEERGGGGGGGPEADVDVEDVGVSAEGAWIDIGGWC